MRGTFAGLLLAVTALVMPGWAVAGPPEGVSGKMAFDEVAEGLRKYRAEKTPGKRIRWLEKLAASRDPRVAVVIWDSPKGDWTPLQYALLGRMLHKHYTYGNVADYEWWAKNEADFRRRAAQLPR
jgi:hypothetical protein